MPPKMENPGTRATAGASKADHIGRLIASENTPDDGNLQAIAVSRLTPLDSHGQYLIDVAGVSIKSKYPANRMARALSLAGLTGSRPTGCETGEWPEISS